MARRYYGRATSRFTGELIQIHPGKTDTCAALWLFFCCLLFPSAAEAGLYSASDQVVLLTTENVQPVLVNSTAAMVVEFYASWCGHCIAFSPVYKSLARDIKEWKPAVDLAAVDCASDANRKICVDFGITGYPSIKFFHAYSKADSKGKAFTGFPRDIRGLRHRIIDQLETHKELWPPACPPLEPTSQAEIDSFFETNNVEHLALIFEDAGSYLGREVTLDLLQYDNIAVRRVLSTEADLVTKLGVTEFPSCYLYHPRGNFTRLKVHFEARSFYSYALQRLPRVVRSGKPPAVTTDFHHANDTQEPGKWKPFNKSRVYMADLESALHYSLRVELSAQPLIKGEALVSLKNYISVLAKFFPGRPIVMNLLRSVNTQLQNHTSNNISYDAFRDMLDNSAQTPDAALPEGVRWVGCQSSTPNLRRYPCGMWTLFHVLTAQAHTTGGTDAQEVLGAMRSYVRSFFGCRSCAEHFENMAKESMVEVSSVSAAVLWLWSRHNRVNNRLAGALSEDPSFPKIQWPSPEMCPACHTVKDNGEHRWNHEQVLSFLLSYFSPSNILTEYLEDDSQVLAKQKERQASRLQALEDQKRGERKAREASDPQTPPLPPSQPAVQEEEEEEEEEQEEEEEEEAVAQAQTTTPWAKGHVEALRRGGGRGKPSIVGMRMREPTEDIVDLDSFSNHHYRAKALLASSRLKRRSLQRNVVEQQEPGMELMDTGGVGMLGLQRFDLDPPLPDARGPKKRMHKRELTGQYFVEEEEDELGRRRRWMSMLSVGFSKLDISLCVILYFLSSMCLLAMYMFFKSRLRLRRVKVALP